MSDIEQQAPRWVPLSERLPNLNEANSSGDVIVGGGRVRPNTLSVASVLAGSLNTCRTHWMTAPEPPEPDPQPGSEDDEERLTFGEWCERMRQKLEGDK